MNNIQNVPEEMKAIPRWAVFECAPNRGKKIPILRNGRPFSPDDASTWVDFQTALRICDTHKQVKPDHRYLPAFVLGNDYFCADIDPSKDPAKYDRSKAWADNTIAQTIEARPTWCEISASGLGYHAFYRNTTVDTCVGFDIKQEDGTVQILTGVRFIIMTGEWLRWSKSTITPLPFPTNRPAAQSNPDYVPAQVDSRTATSFGEALIRALVQQTDAAYLMKGNYKTKMELIDALGYNQLPEGEACYPEWTNIGHAIKHSLGVDGYPIFRAFSAISPGYTNDQDVALQWGQLSDVGSLHIETLFFKARESGWNRAPVEVETMIRQSESSGGDSSNEEIIANQLEGQRLIADAILRYSDGHVSKSGTREFKNGRNDPPIVNQVFRQGEVGMVFGASGSKKTYNVMDLAYCVSNGLPFAGYTTFKTKTLYVAAEASASVLERRDAIQIVKGEHSFDVYKIPVDITGRRKVKLAMGADTVELTEMLVLEAYCKLKDYRFIVFDTYRASVVGSDENSNSHVGEVYQNLQAIARNTSAACLFVHHTNKGGTDASGAGAFRSQADFSLMVNPGRNEMESIMKIDKLKRDRFDPKREHTAFFKTVEIGIDAHTNTIVTDLIIESWDASKLDDGKVANVAAMVDKKLGVVDCTKAPKDRLLQWFTYDMAVLALGIHLENGSDSCDSGAKLYDMAYKAIADYRQTHGLPKLTASKMPNMHISKERYGAAVRAAVDERIKTKQSCVLGYTSIGADRYSFFINH